MVFWLLKWSFTMETSRFPFYATLLITFNNNSMSTNNDGYIKEINVLKAAFYIALYMCICLAEWLINCFENQQFFLWYLFIVTYLTTSQIPYTELVLSTRQLPRSFQSLGYLSVTYLFDEWHKYNNILVRRFITSRNIESQNNALKHVHATLVSSYSWSKYLKSFKWNK